MWFIIFSKTRGIHGISVISSGFYKIVNILEIVTRKSLSILILNFSILNAWSISFWQLLNDSIPAHPSVRSNISHTRMSSFITYTHYVSSHHDKSKSEKVLLLIISFDIADFTKLTTLLLLILCKLVPCGPFKSVL
jgi:hypothetical protein